MPLLQTKPSLSLVSVLKTKAHYIFLLVSLFTCPPAITTKRKRMVPLPWVLHNYFWVLLRGRNPISKMRYPPQFEKVHANSSSKTVKKLLLSSWIYYEITVWITLFLFYIIVLNLVVDKTKVGIFWTVTCTVRCSYNSWGKIQSPPIKQFIVETIFLFYFLTTQN